MWLTIGPTALAVLPLLLVSITIETPFRNQVLLQTRLASCLFSLASPQVGAPPEVHCRLSRLGKQPVSPSSNLQANANSPKACIARFSTQKGARAQRGRKISLKVSLPFSPELYRESLSGNRILDRKRFQKRTNFLQKYLIEEISKS